MEFNAIFSQAALATCLRYPPTEGTVEGGVPKEMGALVKMESVAEEKTEGHSTSDFRVSAIKGEKAKIFSSSNEQILQQDQRGESIQNPSGVRVIKIDSVNLNNLFICGSLCYVLGFYYFLCFE
jgi:hypothetical protein